jgi:hypothetical protein
MNHRSTANQQRELQKSVTAFRSPKRITITVAYGTKQKLLDRSDREGRSLSNLAAFLIESTLNGTRKIDNPLM